MRPLDQIPELIGAYYNVAISPVFIHGGNLYTVRTKRVYKEFIIHLVSKHSQNLWVHCCTSDRNTYIIQYAIIKDRITSHVRLRIIK